MLEMQHLIIGKLHCLTTVKMPSYVPTVNYGSTRYKLKKKDNCGYERAKINIHGIKYNYYFDTRTKIMF